MRRLRPRGGIEWLAAGFGAVALVALAVAAVLLASSQASQREDLRERYADRVVIAGALLDALFRTAFVGQTTELTQKLGGSRVRTSTLEAQARSRDELWSAVVDRSGELLGTSASAPLDVARRLPRMPFVDRAFGGGGYALGDVRGGLVYTAIRFPARSALDESRAYVAVAPPATLGRFLEGALGPLPGVSGARAYILDGAGFPVAGLARESTGPERTAPLLRALDARTTGWFRAADGRRFFASAPIANSRWRLAITVPERGLYAPLSGLSRWIPWIILAIGAVALAGVGLLLRRLLRTTGQLGRANADLERSNSELEHFAYVASHDLSEPLRTIGGFSQLLAHRYGERLDDEAGVYLAHIGAGVDRMQQLIDDLLVYSRAGRTPLNASDVDLEELLDEVVRELAPAVEEREAEITHDDLPAVRGDRGQLFQVLQNLLANALKFTAPDVTPRVHVGARPDQGLWRIEVTDNGIGVAPEQRDAIFKMFRRLHSADAYPGTGIGLALVQRIVERHGGRIWVEPADGAGSRFAFTVPAAAAAPGPVVRPTVPA